MFYKVKVKDYIRVPPKMFSLGRRDAVLQNIKTTYENFISKELGFILNIGFDQLLGTQVHGNSARYVNAVSHLDSLIVGANRRRSIRGIDYFFHKANKS